MTNYAQIWLILANCGRIYGQKWPDLWPNKIVGMAMAMVAMPDFMSMEVYFIQQSIGLNVVKDLISTIIFIARSQECKGGSLIVNINNVKTRQASLYI